jgi:hypothetical protein
VKRKEAEEIALRVDALEGRLRDEPSPAGD